MHSRAAVYYRVERVYVTDVEGRTVSRRDLRPYLVAGGSARDAALAFIKREQHELVGSISDFPGDKALATAAAGPLLYVIFVERGAESVAGDRNDTRNEAR